VILYAALLFFIGSLVYFLGYHRGLARGRFEMTEAHVAAKMAEYNMAAPADHDGVGWQ